MSSVTDERRELEVFASIAIVVIAVVMFLGSVIFVIWSPFSRWPTIIIATVLFSALIYFVERFIFIWVPRNDNEDETNEDAL